MSTKIQAGIHFGMPFERYLDVRAVSASGVKYLHVSPLTFWTRTRWLNPNRDDSGSEATLLGKALHKRVLEGAEAYGEAFAVKPAPADYPDALDGAEALRERCGELGLKKSGRIDEMCQRLLEADPEAQLWPVIHSRLLEEIGNKTILSPRMADHVERMASAIEKDPNAAPAFRGGFPEVSVFWTDPKTRTPMKARIDYLKAGGILVDLKTFSNSIDLPIGQAAAMAVARQRYHVQAALYLRAAKAMRQFAKKGLVFGDPRPAARWLEILAETTPSFFFVFFDSGESPHVIVRQFLPEGCPDAQAAADKIIDGAIDRFHRCLRKFGLSPWDEPEPVRPFADGEFPGYLLMEA